jgi:hypothetical protein
MSDRVARYGHGRTSSANHGGNQGSVGSRFDHDQRVQARLVTEDSAVIEVSRHDKVQQRVTSQMIMLDGQGMHLRPVAIRYGWPAELDLMADRAGLRLAERYADWDRRRFTSASSGHVSVYQPA